MAVEGEVGFLRCLVYHRRVLCRKKQEWLERKKQQAWKAGDGREGGVMVGCKTGLTQAYWIQAGGQQLTD